MDARGNPPAAAQYRIIEFEVEVAGVPTGDERTAPLPIRLRRTGAPRQRPPAQRVRRLPACAPAPRRTGRTRRRRRSARRRAGSVSSTTPYGSRRSCASTTTTPSPHGRCSRRTSATRPAGATPSMSATTVSPARHVLRASSIEIGDRPAVPLGITARRPRAARERSPFTKVIAEHRTECPAGAAPEQAHWRARPAGSTVDLTEGWETSPFRGRPPEPIMFGAGGCGPWQT
jgi:hypothetical protein